MKHTIEHNAAEIRRLKQAIDDAFARRSESTEHYEAWKRACAEFHARYDALAFPGGLHAGLERLASGDLLVAETALEYLELHPYFFRSQYNATKLVRRLKKLQLPFHLQQRFQNHLKGERQRRLKKP